MRTTSATGNSRAGFTLIELSVVVFIIALLVGVSAPSFVRSYNSAVVGDVARNFATTCRYARLQAVSQQRPATVFVNLDQQRFWLVQTGTVDGELVEQTLKTYQLPNRVTFLRAEVPDATNSDPRQAVIQFYPNGTCDAAMVTLIGNDKNSIAVTLDPITCKPETFAVK